MVRWRLDGGKRSWKQRWEAAVFQGTEELQEFLDRRLPGDDTSLPSKSRGKNVHLRTWIQSLSRGAEKD